MEEISRNIKQYVNIQIGKLCIRKQDGYSLHHENN